MKLYFIEDDRNFVIKNSRLWIHRSRSEEKSKLEKYQYEYTLWKELQSSIAGVKIFAKLIKNYL